MAKFLTTKGIVYEVESLIREAREQIIIVSPFLGISETFFQRLKDATGKGIDITVVFRDSESALEQRQKLESLSSVNLFNYHHLHAKCYLNEKTFILSTMNFTESSERNREMGIVASRINDTDLYHDGVTEVMSIITSSSPLRTKHLHYKNPDEGVCIRCSKKISFDPSKPYCYECYTVWAQYSNPLYEESVCHNCSKPERTSLEYPQCLDCFKEYQRNVKKMMWF